MSKISILGCGAWGMALALSAHNCSHNVVMWSPFAEEVELLKTKGLFYPLHFSVNILRCETAALYGIAAIQTAMTELDEWHTHE